MAIKILKDLPVHDRIISALTQYDEQQSKRKGYNPHALALYFEALERAEHHATKLSDGVAFAWSDRLEIGLKHCFNDRVLTLVLKALHA